jgi:hypothetical protein
MQIYWGAVPFVLIHPDHHGADLMQMEKAPKAAAPAGADGSLGPSSDQGKKP